MNRKLMFAALVPLAFALLTGLLLATTAPTPEIYAQDEDPTAIPTETPGPTFTPSATVPPFIPAGALRGTIIRAEVLIARQQPYFSAPEVGRVLRGETYQVVGRNPNADWFLIQLSTGQGWVWGYYVFIDGNEFSVPVANPFTNFGAPADSAALVVQATATLNMRAQPNVGAERVGRVTWGDTVAVIGRSRVGSWYQVAYKGTTGWIYAPYTDVVEGSENDVPYIDDALVAPPPPNADVIIVTATPQIIVVTATPPS
jgi:uncharacterized protein YgiM (DUF1202 family)